MKQITYTLITDGSSDRRLIPILNWLFYSYCHELAIQAKWVDFSKLRRPPKTLVDKIKKGLELYPCALLFIHRDAENQSLTTRRQEITQAVSEAIASSSSQLSICIIPVRMQEAWLLFNETAIRKATGNPNGRTSIQLPHISSLETIPNPKFKLFDLLKLASELSGRRLRNLNLHRKAYLVAEYISDFSPLRNVPAFSELEKDLVNSLRANNWINEG